MAPNKKICKELKTAPNMSKSSHWIHNPDVMSHRDSMKLVAANGLNLCLVPHKTVEVVTRALMQNGNAYRHLTPQQKMNPTLIHLAIKYGATPDNKFPPPVRSNREYMIPAIDKDGLNLQYLPVELRDSFEFSLRAVFQNPNAIDYVSQSLKDDDVFMSIVTKSTRKRGR